MVNVTDIFNKDTLSSSLDGDNLGCYSKPSLIEYGSVLALTAGCSGSGTDGGTMREPFVGPDGSTGCGSH